MKSVALHNLGCKVNSYELDVIEQELVAAGYEIRPFDQPADVYIINTCTVTNIADRKSRQMLHRAKKENPSAIVIAVGCYVETNAEKVKMDECIDIAVGNNRKAKIVDILKKYESEHSVMSSESPSDSSQMEKTESEADAQQTAASRHTIDMEMDDSIKISSTEKTAYEEMKLAHAPEHTRAYIKIQDGCNQFCSYCLIPYARGRIRSRAQGEIVAEILGLAALGVKEVVLTGIHISSYGLDREGSELLDLLRKVHAIKGIERIRLGSLEPRIITEENAKAFASMPKLCPHFHLSLQSGCEETLKRMNRHYTAEEYIQGVELLRKVYDRPAITTDVIVGFPGETPEEFEESRAFCEKVNFYEMHVFKYSVRKGTAAEKLKGQLTEHQKAERSDVLLTLTAAQAKAYRESFLGEKCKVLFEDVEEIDHKLYLVGHTERYLKVAKEIAAREEGAALSGTFYEGTCSGFLTEDTLLLTK